MTSSNEQQIVTVLTFNPWQVSNLDEFLFYCCPQCDHRAKDHQEFVVHAINEHEEAREVLLKVKVEAVQLEQLEEEGRTLGMLRC